MPVRVVSFLSKLGEYAIPAKLITIPGAGHGPTFPGAKNPPDFIGEMVAWFDKYLTD